MFSRTLLWLVISAAFTALVIQHSYSHGKLLCPPFYDDVAYFEDAIHRLEVFYNGGAAAILADYYASPPHSPFSSFLAAGAYAILGLHDWAPYVANGLVILALLIPLDGATGPAHVAHKIAIALFVLCIPISAEAVYEFRPDIPSALACAAGAMLLLSRPLSQTHRTYRLVAGALFGLALLFKPPTFPLTVALFLTSLATATILDWALLRTVQWRTLASAWMQIAFPLVLIPLPHYLLTWRETWAYIYDPIFGPGRQVWASDMSLRQHLLYYLTGEAGLLMLGAELRVLAIILAVGVIVLLFKRQWQILCRVAGMLFVLAVAYAIPSCMPLKQRFFGASFDWLLTFTAVYMLSLLPKSPGRLHALILIAVTSCAIFRFTFTANDYSRGVEIVLAQNRVADGLYHELRRALPQPWSRVYLTTTGYISSAVLDYYFRRDTLHSLNIGDNPFTDDLAIHRREIDVAEFVIASEPGNGMAFSDFLKSGAVQSQTLDMVRQNRDFKQIAAYPALNDKHFFLFRRSRPFFGFESSHGLLEASPAQRQDLPSAYFGVRPITLLVVPPNGPPTLRIAARARAQTPDLVIKIVVDGEPRGTWAPGVDHFQDLTLPFTIHGGGPHRIELFYDPPDPATPTPVIFATLQIIPGEPN